MTEEQVTKIIQDSPTKSCSLDPWPTFLVLEFLDILITPITSIINASLAQGTCPKIFKQAHVTPILKKSSLDQEVFKNYRPVSNLNFISKILERVVAAQLQTHLDEAGLMTAFQLAYRKHHSTESALLNIHNDILLNMAKGSVTALTLLDLSAAFDTIDHTILLDRLSGYYGISELALGWFKSYLSGRTHSVKVGSTLSNPVTLQHGVPQGSVLGPILFSLYTNPISSIIQSHSGINYHFYADDTQLHISLSPANFSQSVQKLKNCLNDIQNFMFTNKLKLNPDKTEFILIGSKNTVNNSFLTFQSIFLVIRSHQHKVSRTSEWCLIFSLSFASVSSRLDYCNSLFLSLTDFELRRLQLVQNLLCRVVTVPQNFLTSPLN